MYHRAVGRYAFHLLPIHRSPIIPSQARSPLSEILNGKKPLQRETAVGALARGGVKNRLVYVRKATSMHSTRSTEVCGRGWQGKAANHGIARSACLLDNVRCNSESQQRTLNPALLGHIGGFP